MVGSASGHVSLSVIFFFLKLLLKEFITCRLSFRTDHPKARELLPQLWGETGFPETEPGLLGPFWLIATVLLKQCKPPFLPAPLTGVGPACRVQSRHACPVGPPWRLNPACQLRCWVRWRLVSPRPGQSIRAPVPLCTALTFYFPPLSLPVWVGRQHSGNLWGWT